MADLADGETKEAKGSSAKPYLMRNTGGVYSCSCPAWRNQSVAIERRTCKHLRALRGEAAELARTGAPSVPPGRPGTPGTPGAAVAPGNPEAAAGPPLLLAHSWANDADLTGWWISEKLDGVRAYWDGKTFISRLGNPYHAPAWFLEGLPDTLSVGTGLSDAERSAPPALGSIITYRYQELSTGGVPRFPSFVCVRDDLPWPSPASPPPAAKPAAQKTRQG